VSGDEAYALTPQAAEELAKDARGFRAALTRELGESGDALFLLTRFAEGRERRELPPPTVAECEVVGRHFAEVLAFATLFELVLKGMVFIDVKEENGELTTAFSLTTDGREAVEGGTGL